MKIIQEHLTTIGDLRKFLQEHPEISDTVKLESFGPDCGGYDYTQSNDVAISYEEGSDTLLLAASEDDGEIAIWDKLHGNIIGRTKCHTVFRRPLSNNPTIKEIEELNANGAKIEFN